MPTMVKESKLPKHKVTECLNALLHSKDVIKQSQRVSVDKDGTSITIFITIIYLS